MEPIVVFLRGNSRRHWAEHYDIHILSEEEQIPAIVEITHNLEQVLARIGSNHKQISSFLKILVLCDEMLLERETIITKQLQALPPTLVNQRQFWLELQHHLQKILIRKAKSFPANAINNLFQNQQESAQLHQEKNVGHHALRAWIVLCDEYTAYMQQFPLPWKEKLCQQYESFAIQALEQAEILLKQQKNTIGLEEYMLGIAEFSLLLLNDKDKARYWLLRFDASGTNLNHKAAWFREKHGWVSAIVKKF